MLYKCVDCGRQKYIASSLNIPKACPKCHSPNLIRSIYCPYCKEHYFDLGHNEKCIQATFKRRRNF